jgi:hypothetical protein
MPDNQNGLNITVLPSADMAKLFYPIKKYFIGCDQPSLAAAGNTVMKLPGFARDFCQSIFSTYSSRP